jgi:hypothetical protein
VPHPNVHLVEPAAVATILLRVGGGASKTPIVLEAQASIAEAERIRRKRISESRIRSGATRKRRSEAAAAAGAAKGGGVAHCITGHDIISEIIFYIISYVYMISNILIMISFSKSLTMLRGVHDVCWCLSRVAWPLTCS